MKRRARILAGLLACLMLAGCNGFLGSRASMEELLRAPQLAGDYGMIQSALNEWLGESAQLKYPLSGELVSPFLMSDYDGDGVQDAAVLYTTSGTPNVCLALLQRDTEGKWKVKDAIEGLTESVDSVRFAHLQEGGADQIVLGYAASPEEYYLAVYSYADGQILSILEQPCEQYLIEQITSKSCEDLILMGTSEEGGVQIELLTSDREGGFRQVAVMGLFPDRFVGCASLAAGVGADGGQYLVLDGWTGVSGTNLASVLLRFNEETQQMEPAQQIGTNELYEASFRNVSTLISQDLDGDGVVEIPTQPEEAGLLNMSQGRRMDFIVWMDYTSPQPQKSFGLLDEEMGYYLELPMEWEGNLLLTDSTEYENAVELRSLDGEQLYMTVRIAGTAESSVGWTRLGVIASRQIQARLEPDAVIEDPLYRLSRSLYIL
ncbi:hypothetical protein [Faecalibacterium gallinarum]|uniref:VCBS repeat-containing protein n=1 Tax=Faecalibacterium gallinarum TaxID=2903556 RepID=A0AA37IYK4_9FIRM|nr:hypothetical protein [Faecalibacterium gallinarum]GJN64689.1 hypothetical protein JCM17207_13140 [Faecalibacterium gallinarum]